jgi:hypothetical protein
MALLYPWATKEYLLWEMSLGQIILYHNLGIEQKYGNVKSRKPKKASEMDYEELKKLREKLRSEYGDIGEDD